MVYGYIRVSTDKQAVENQCFEIQRFCTKNGLAIGRWIEETISGTKSPGKRLLGPLLTEVKKDDLIICSELSRLGRKVRVFLQGYYMA
jgi:DNA invertase Pin-like site-specific DNA recombinase